MYVGELWGCHHGCQVLFCTSVGTWTSFETLWRARGSCCEDDGIRQGITGFLLCWPREVQSSIRVASESWRLLSPLRPLRGLQETRVATREESGVLGFPSRRGLTPRGSLECNPEIPAFTGEAPPDKDLESPSTTLLEALVPSRDSRAVTRSPSPRAWRPVFPVPSWVPSTVLHFSGNVDIF